MLNITVATITIQYKQGVVITSKMMKMLKSDDKESKQRQLARLKREVVQLTEEIQLIEMTLDSIN